jgi:SanA protein
LRWFGRILLLTLIVGAIGLGAVVLLDRYVQKQGTQYIMQPDNVPGADAILVLGANVFPDGTVSLMLGDRLRRGHELYKKGKAPKILVSGDHGQKDYDEVRAMKNFLLIREVPTDDIFMDHAGFSTYESVYRACAIFKIEKVIIVSQAYHLPRAIFTARQLGLEAYGVASDLNGYGQIMKAYRLREALARAKDFFLAKIEPKPTFLGEPIPVTGDGRVTDDEGAGE